MQIDYGAGEVVSLIGGEIVDELADGGVRGGEGVAEHGRKLAK